MRSYSHLRLTPVREEAKTIGAKSFAGQFSGYDEYVPMVDKAVDSIWKKQPSTQKPCDLKGTLIEPTAQKRPEKLHLQMWLMLVAFFMTIFAFFSSMISRSTKKLHDTTSEHAQNTQEFSFDASTKEEFRPPSPTPSLKEAELLSSVMKILGEVEKKVDDAL